MAELLNKIPSNLTEYPNSFKRQGAFPLEAYSVFYTKDAAEAYASSNPISYVGQTLAVVTANAENPAVVDDVTFYIIADAEGTLQEVGKATNGDDNTITLIDGVLSLKGFDAAPNATLPQKAPVYVKDEEGNDTDVVDHYELRWVAIDAIVEGDTNTKTVVARGDEETHVIIETVRDEANDTNTYKISLDLSAYATSAAVGEAINAAKEELNGAIAAEKAAREAAIGVASAPAVGEEGAEDYVPAVEASGLHAVIEEGNAALEQKIAEALAEAKQYADDNDTDTVYDDTKVKADIADHESRIGAIESALGDETQGLIKDVAANAQAIVDEAAAREQADEDTLDAAKGYTDEQITGLDIVIEKKTVEDVESDYIVIKNKSGVEVASVNAAKFVKDGMLESADYSTDTKKLVLTWNTDAGKTATEIDLNDLVNTYTGSDHIIVGTDGKISITDDVALESDLTALETAFDKAIEDEAKARDDADKAIGERIDGVVADVALKAVASEVEEALAAKADKETFEAHVEAYGEFVEGYNADKETFATKTDLENKVDVTTYANDKSTFATKTDVASEFTAMGTRVGAAEDSIAANTEALNAFKTEVATDYATKTEVAGVDAKADSNTNLITNLTGRLDGIVAQGGEPNTINTIKVNGVAQAIDSEKAVDITVPVISETKVSQLNDGQALLDRTTAAEGKITALETGVANNQTAISTLSGQVSALSTEVTVNVDARLDALEGAVNGGEGVEGLVGTTTTLVSDVAGLKTEDGRLAALIQSNTNKFADYQTKADAEAQQKELSDAIANVDLTSRVAVTDFEAYKTAQKALTDTLAVAADVEATFETVNTEIAKKADKTELANYYTKDEANAEFMTEAEVKATVDAVVAAAVDTDTLEGLAQLVTYVHENAGDIAKLVTDVENNGKAIEKNVSDIAANKAAHEQNAADIEALATTVAAQKVIDSTEITTSTVEGGIQLGIKEVNVSKLVQSEGDILILNGGSATA
jgi:hypothetical protein